jgi:hypothetical protein
MNVPFSLLLAAERAIHPGTVAAGKQAYPDIARKSVGPLAASAVVTITSFGRDPESFALAPLVTSEAAGGLASTRY